ncbi:hypothetical protein HK098_000673 [Nowakowskiella sp. JEL0407]|nr:hypothetical protein HK098_000673 [Nowakowskiella sp. JEL0407]
MDKRQLLYLTKVLATLFFVNLLVIIPIVVILFNNSKRHTNPPVGSPGETTWEDAISRAKTVVAGMNLSEKVALVTGDGVVFDKTVRKCTGNTPPNSRINFPGLCLQDGPTGVRWATAVSAFPSGINVASTFNKDLMYAQGKAIGEEFRGTGVNVWLGPVLNLARTPEGGRNWEGSGGDQYLSAISNSLQIKGAQGVGVIATAKHFIGNDQEHGRNTGGSTIDDRTLREVYLVPFEAAIEAGVAAIMCSYNKINQTDLACESAPTLNVAKTELGFKGLIMSDWWAVVNGTKAANAGMDLLMPGDTTCCGGVGVSGTPWGKNLISAVNSGTVSQSRVDDMVIRNLAAFYKVGQDRGYPAIDLKAYVQSPEHVSHIRKLGGESTVLLKNDGILPIKSGVNKIAVIGADAGPGNGPNFFEDRAGLRLTLLSGTLAMGWGSGTCEFPYLITPESAIKVRASDIGASVTSSLRNSDLNTAKSTAMGADIAFVFVAANSGEGYKTVEGNAGDRNNLNLWDNGDSLISAVADVNSNTVVVIHTVGAVLMPWVNHPNIKAIIFAGLPGQESGNALADVLFGSVVPSGRLPFTINSNSADYGAHVNYSSNAEVTYSEGIFIDYKWNDLKGIKPLFPFGHGLSYTRFKYSNLAINVTYVNATQTIVKVTVDVKNVGEVTGQEVVQLYVGLPSGVSAPVKQLRGFEKPSIEPGNVTNVEFSLRFRDFSYWNVVNQNWTIPQGTFTIYVGASSGDIKLQVGHNLSKEIQLKMWKPMLASLLLVNSFVQAAVGVTWDDAVSRAKTVVAGMTLEEKVNLVTGDGAPWKRATKKCIGNTPPNERINFPGFCLQDGPTGVRWATSISAFPAGVNVASTFNKDLMYAHGKSIGEEFKTLGINVWLGPVFNLARTPEGGRNWEGAGADHVEQVKGAQDIGVIATAKHYILNDQEHGRKTGGSSLDDRTMREVYLVPFEAAVDAGVGAVMCSYNKINKTDFGCENSQTLSLLKKDLGFKGLVMSDWWAITGSGVKAANAGLDLMMPGDTKCCNGLAGSGSPWGANLTRAVNAGNVSEDRVSDMAIRNLATFYKVGQDKGYPPVNISANAQTPEHVAHIRKVGAESTVLLKNNGILPIKKSVRKIALVGSDAGPGAGPNFFSDRAGLNGTLAVGWGSGTVDFPYLITPEQGIREQAIAQGVNVSTSLLDSDLAAAVSAVKGADIAFVFAASDSGENYKTVNGHVGDRNNLTLWNDADILINTVADANKNTVVVIHSVGQVLMPWINHRNIKAVLYAGLPGQESGNALADILFGKLIPSGRLPFTINANISDYGAHVVYDSNAEHEYTEGLFVDYKWNDLKGVKPLFPFGHGLSYTDFDYNDIEVVVDDESTLNPEVEVFVDVENSGKYTAQEVVQLYVGLPSGYGAPIKQLRAFEKPTIPKGTTTTIRFLLLFRDFAYWDTVSQKWTVPAGKFTVYVGASAGDIRLKSTFTLKAPPAPKCKPRLAQCGGLGYSGATCCVPGSACQVVNQFFSQCK